MIPFKAFALAMQHMANITAAEQLQAVNQTAHGIALALNGKQGGVQDLTHKLEAMAFPKG